MSTSETLEVEKSIDITAFADERMLSVPTEAFGIGVGVTADAQGPRPDLSGLRVKLPAQPSIWLIDPEGFRRGIPNPETYNNLFRSWGGVVEDINANSIAE